MDIFKRKMKNSKKQDKKELKYNPNVTEHDKDILKQKNIHGDGGDDQQLRERKDKVDFEGSGLDVPGREKAKKQKGNQLRDEENQLFSQGGETKENLEQDNTL